MSGPDRVVNDRVKTESEALCRHFDKSGNKFYPLTWPRDLALTIGQQKFRPIEMLRLRKGDVCAILAPIGDSTRLSAVYVNLTRTLTEWAGALQSLPAFNMLQDRNGDSFLLARPDNTGQYQVVNLDSGQTIELLRGPSLLRRASQLYKNIAGSAYAMLHTADADASQQPSVVCLSEGKLVYSSDNRPCLFSPDARLAREACGDIMVLSGRATHRLQGAIVINEGEKPTVSVRLLDSIAWIP